MKLNKQKPRNFINPLLSRKSVDTDKFNAFKLALEHYKKSLASQINTKKIQPDVVTNTFKALTKLLSYLIHSALLAEKCKPTTHIYASWLLALVRTVTLRYLK